MPALMQKLECSFRIARFGKVEALRQIAIEVSDLLELGLCFNSFGDDLQPYPVAQQNDRVDNFASLFILHVGDEAPIDLQGVYRQTL